MQLDPQSYVESPPVVDAGGKVTFQDSRTGEPVTLPEGIGRATFREIGRAHV